MNDADMVCDKFMSQSNSHSPVPSHPSPSWLPRFGASGACLFIFMIITWLMLTNEGLQELDQDLALACKEHAASHPTVREFLLLFTHLGGRGFLAELACVAILFSLWRRHFFFAGIWILATGGGGLLNFGVKNVIERPRPPVELRDSALRLQHDSFPSGHAMGSTIGLGMCLYAGVLFLRRKQVQLALAVSTVLLVGLIGFSRVYLRAHWLSDVLAGFTLGAAWLLLCIGIHQWYRTERRRDKETER